MYAVQTETLKMVNRDRLDSLWLNFCRKLVKAGFCKKLDEDGVQNVVYKYDVDEIFKIHKALQVSPFCLKQSIEYMAHVVRMSNASEQERWLFSKSEVETNGKILVVISGMTNCKLGVNYLIIVY